MSETLEPGELSDSQSLEDGEISLTSEASTTVLFRPNKTSESQNYSLESGEIMNSPVSLEEGEISDRRVVNFETVKQRLLSKINEQEITKKMPEKALDSSDTEDDFKRTITADSSSSALHQSLISESRKSSADRTLKWSQESEPPSDPSLVKSSKPTCSNETLDEQDEDLKSLEDEVDQVIELNQKLSEIQDVHNELMSFNKENTSQNNLTGNIGLKQESDSIYSPRVVLAEIDTIFKDCRIHSLPTHTKIQDTNGKETNKLMTTETHNLNYQSPQKLTTDQLRFESVELPLDVSSSAENIIEIYSKPSEIILAEQMEVEQEITVGQSDTETTTSDSVDVQKLIEDMEVDNNPEDVDTVTTPLSVREIQTEDTQNTPNYTLSFDTQLPVPTKKSKYKPIKKRFLSRAATYSINRHTIPIRVCDLERIETVDKFLHWFSGIYFDYVLLYGKVFPGRRKDEHNKVCYSLDDGTGTVDVHFKHNSPKFMGDRLI